jgi:hypothetical protein
MSFLCSEAWNGALGSMPITITHIDWQAWRCLGWWRITFTKTKGRYKKGKGEAEHEQPKNYPNGECPQDAQNGLCLLTHYASMLAWVSTKVIIRQ